ncbi:MAG: efflux RND transporter periplasmic adaptor subunit [Ideonella sp.]|nr:efflux RND transporter periplasmic adaptor subunit [Ideonella sp.]
MSPQRFSGRLPAPSAGRPPVRPTPRVHAAWLSVLLWVALVPPVGAAGLQAAAVQPSAPTVSTGYDGVVEAVRQTVVAAQVPGAIVQLEVKVGDRVAAGQLLLRIDARAADQNAAASDAQVQAARASLDVATKDVERQRQLFQKNYISQAALERAESAYQATRAQVNAQLAQAGAARTQTGFHLVRAPFAGIVSEVPASLGDMAMPGKPLLTLYDPAVLRVTASLPQSVAAQLGPNPVLRLELPGTANGVVPTRVQLLPTIDPATHTVPLRAELPAGTPGLAPGMFARVFVPVDARTSARPSANPSVPLQAVVRRAEMTGVYVLDTAGRPVLRQVRLGRVDGDRVEVLSGLGAGERVAADPQAAAKVQ